MKNESEKQDKYDLEKEFAEFLQKENEQKVADKSSAREVEVSKIGKNNLENSAKLESLAVSKNSDKSLHQDIQNSNSEKPEHNKEKLETTNNSKILTNISSENIKINLQVSHIYIFGFIAICSIILNIATWSLVFGIISIFDYFLPRNYQFINSGIFQSLMLILFVAGNYKIQAKYLPKIFDSMKID